MPSNGKGDASRVTDQSAYAANFDEINWGPKPAPPQDNFVENESEWRSQTIPGTKEFKSSPFLDVIAPTSDIVRE